MKTMAGLNRRILFAAAGFALLLWFLDTVGDYFLFHQGQGGFWDILILHPPAHEVFTRSLFTLLVITGGVLLSRFFSHQEAASRILRDSENQYRTLVSNIEERHFIYTHDVHGIFTYLSPSITTILGYTPEEFKKHYTAYLTDNPLNKEVERHTELSIQGVKQPPYEVEILHKNGSLRWLEVSETPIVDARGRVTAVHGIARDITDRRNVEQALRASEDKYRSLYTSMTELVVLHEVISGPDNRAIDYRILDCNPAFEAITGISCGKASGALASQLYGVDPAPYLDTYARVAETGDPEQFETYFPPMDKHFRISAFSLGQRRFATVASDITISKKNEEVIKLNEERLQGLLQLSQMTEVPEKGITEYALEEIVKLTRSTVGYLHFVNEDQDSIELVSWSKGTIALCTAEKVTHYPLSKAGIWADCVRLRQPVLHNDFPAHPGRRGYPEGHFPVVRHMSVPVFDGDRIVAIAGVGNKTAPYDGSDARQLTLFMNSMWAIIKQKRADEVLHTTKAKLDLASSIAHLGHWDWDTMTGALAWTDEVYRIFGYEPGDIVPSYDQFISWIHPDDRQRIQQAVAASLRQPVPYDVEFRFIRRDGTGRIGRATGSAEFDRSGAAVRLSGAMQDITDLRRAEEELRRLYEQTQQDAETKAELLREVNHRVKNNLVAIVGLLLAEKKHAPAEGRRAVEKAIDNIINRVEALNEVHQYLSEHRWAPMRLSDLAERIIGTVCRYVPSGQKVEVTILPSPIEVSPRQASNLALVFNELAINSLKYAIDTRETLRISSACRMEGDLIAIEYRDNGPGYSPEVLSSERKGVGLSLLQGLVTGSLRGHLTLANDGGSVTIMRIKVEEKDRT